jgi:hypothetical protein
VLEKTGGEERRGEEEVTGGREPAWPTAGCAVEVAGLL